MNLDEMWQQDFADTETKTVIVLQCNQDSFAPYPIEMEGDRSTVLDLEVIGAVFDQYQNWIPGDAKNGRRLFSTMFIK